MADDLLIELKRARANVAGAVREKLLAEIGESDQNGYDAHAVLIADIIAKNDIIFRDTVNLHGFEAQIRQLAEEMAELFVALNHLARGKSASWRDVADEVADVYTLLAQVPHIVWSIFDHYDEFVDMEKFSLRVTGKVRKNLSALRERIKEDEGEA